MAHARTPSTHSGRVPALRSYRCSRSATSSAVCSTRTPVEVGPLHALAELQEAAGIAADDGVDARLGDLGELHVEEAQRVVRPHQRVRAGRAAAAAGARQVDDLDARQRGEQRARLEHDLLAVAQVARVLVGDADRHARARVGSGAPGEQRRVVAHARAEVLGLGRPEQQAVVGHERPAAAGRGDDRALAAGERAHRPVGQLARTVEIAVVRVQRAAAALLGRRRDAVARGRERAAGRVRRAREHQVADAAEEQRGGLAGLRADRAAHAPGGRRGHRRRRLARRAQRARGRQPVQSEQLAHAQHAAGEARAARRADREQQPAQLGIARRPDRVAAVLEQRAVLHARPGRRARRRGSRGRTRAPRARRPRPASRPRARASG